MINEKVLKRVLLVRELMHLETNNNSESMDDWINPSQVKKKNKNPNLSAKWLDPNVRLHHCGFICT